MTLNKQQINYLTRKLDTVYHSARNNIVNKTNSEIEDAVRKALSVAGFSYPDARYGSLINWVWTAELKEQKKQAEARNAEVLAELWKEYSRVIDHINLGSDSDAMAIMEAFSAKMKELTGV